MEIILKIGIPFSVALVVTGSFICLGGYFWKVFTSRIIVALTCFILCLLGIHLIIQGPVEIQAKKYIVAMSMALVIYFEAFIFNLVSFSMAYDLMKEAKSEHKARLAMERNRKQNREGGEK